jgi:hypothetical protein
MLGLGSPCEPGLRAALHLEAGPIRCVRGLKSSLVIGQKAQIGPNPFTPRGHADLMVRMFLIKKKHVMTRPELVELGAPKMEG